MLQLFTYTGTIGRFYPSRSVIGYAKRSITVYVSKFNRVPLFIMINNSNIYSILIGKAMLLLIYTKKLKTQFLFF